VRGERIRHVLALSVTLSVAVLLHPIGSPLLAQAQTAAINRAFDLEQAGRMREAIAAWRQVIAAGQAGQGVLGLERVFSQLSQDDSVLPTLDSLLVQTPADKILRGVQLRVLRSLGRESDAHAAFELWVSLSPRDPTPYREYAEELLNDGRAAAADTVLRQATDSLGSTKALTIEVAQLRAALGLWPAAAAAWRDAMLTEEYLEQTAVYSLQATPIAQRDSVRAVLRAATGAPSKKVLGSLELQWGAARDGWRAIASLTAADSAFDTWNDFAQDAERQAQWLAARDAFAAMNRMRPSAATAIRAAAASINGDEPAPALELLASARPQLQPVVVRTQLLPLEIRALTRLGRAAEAEALVAHDSASLDAGTRRMYAREIAWGWIRAGQVERARAALLGASGDDEDEVGAWIALYDGDLVKARAGLRHPTETTAEIVTAMAFLGRTKADSSRSAGAAFLALARGDSAQAVTRLERAADELSDAAPLLLGLAARIQSSRHQDGPAITIWQRILTQYASAPEAAESDLEWARTLRRKGDTAGAVEHLEHLILTYPQSALVPQARRELDAVRTGSALR
jgi:tetratricopeptide (TPR) repeat protein